MFFFVPLLIAVSNLRTVVARIFGFFGSPIGYRKAVTILDQGEESSV
jgi:hypothetical protein